MIIYLDALFLMNYIVNVFIFAMTAFFLKKEIDILRNLGASIVAALYATLMFIPEMHFFYSGLLKVLFLFIPTGILFGFSDIKQHIKNTIVCLLATMGVFATVCLVLSVTTGFSEKCGVIVSNGIIYLDLNPAVLIFGVIISPLPMLFVDLIQSVKIRNEKIYSFTVTVKGKEYKIDALYDTGCTLTDEKTGLPVIIAERGAFDEEFFEEMLENIDVSRLSYSTISNNCETISSFVPERICDKKYTYSAVIGVSPVFRLSTCDVYFNAVMNPDVLETRLKIKMNKKEEATV